jgi:hypothetical protein
VWDGTQQQLQVWSDQAHFAVQDIQKLGELIEVGPTEPRPSLSSEDRRRSPDAWGAMITRWISSLRTSLRACSTARSMVGEAQGEALSSSIWATSLAFVA